MKAISVAVLMAAMLPTLPAQDPANGEYRAPITPDPLKYTPMSLISVTPTGTKVGLEPRGSILYGSDQAWQKLAGKLVQLSAGSDTELWGVNADHVVFRWSGTTWATMPGSLQQVVVAKGGGLVMGIEWAQPHRVVRWDAATNTWIPLVGAPPLVQLAIGSPNHVFGIIATGEIYRLNRPDWIGWRQIKGKLKQISVGMDGTVGGIGVDGVAYLRSDQDITAEINNANSAPSWTPLGVSVSFVEILKVDNVIVLDKAGFPATTQVLSNGGTLSIKSSEIIVSGTPGPPMNSGSALYPADQPKAESSGCIGISKEDLNDPTKMPKNPDGSPAIFTFRCETGKFSKVTVSDCAPHQSLNYGNFGPSKSASGGCLGSSPAVTPTDPPQIDGKGTDCAPRNFTNRSAHSSVRFILPGGRMGETVRIPAGAHNRYVFPACNRVVWDNLTFFCAPTKVWTLLMGKYDADAWCTGSPGRSPYTSIADLGYADK